MRATHASTRRTWLLAPLAAGLLALVVSPALAGRAEHGRPDPGRHGSYKVHHKHSRHEHHRHAHRGPVVRGGFVVPVVIRGERARVYRHYYRGRAYAPAHRHYHAVYRFPVAEGRGYVWRSHAYCGGELYREPVIRHAPRISVHLEF